MEFPHIIVKAEGVGLEHQPGLESFFSWDEIVLVHSYALDLGTHTVNVVSLEHPSGHCLELQSDWPGFEQAVEALSKSGRGPRGPFF